ncbi:acyl-CoA dehydrogenase family protein [Paraburkholderia sp. J12]|uniref:acyl-CoA dehydrogenase family protein n=1 Tax=Paraburkholderia sp. J12 TaxID=2805432 RepID=UPI002ABD237D|nr:acyl-CoA dehydrogenase family protein [Paraburkholderia sp. J12]
MFTEAFEDILRDCCSPVTVRAIEAGGAHTPLWDTITESGFLEVMATEEAGGAGLDLAGVLPILCMLGLHAVPLPVGQAIALRTLLPAGVAPPKGLPTFAPALLREGNGDLVTPRVPFGAIADHVLAELDGTLLLLDAHAAQSEPIGIHGDTTANLRWSASHIENSVQPIHGSAPEGSLRAWGAALHAALLVGALARSFDLTLQYANDRTQFGKSIGKFQVIQHQLAVMAEHVAASRIATANAFAAGRTVPALLPAGIAKARASEAVITVATVAHAVHGAIGVTEEYDLQLNTRRLHAWRIAHGSEAHWHEVIGQALLAARSSTISHFVRELR